MNAMLKRKRNQPKRLDDFECFGPTLNSNPVTPKEHHRKQYFEAVDLLINTIEYRFSQKSYLMFEKLESVLLDALSGKDTTANLKEVEKVYHEDIDFARLACQLDLFRVMLSSDANIICFADIHKKV